MAKQLEAFPVPSTRRYPWDQWLDGSVWQLFKGGDYSCCRTQTALANARSQAKRLGGTVRTRSVTNGDEESLVIQFVRR
jgi:hypothetical protein